MAGGENRAHQAIGQPAYLTSRRLRRGVGRIEHKPQTLRTGRRPIKTGLDSEPPYGNDAGGRNRAASQPIGDGGRRYTQQLRHFPAAAEGFDEVV